MDGCCRHASSCQRQAICSTPIGLALPQAVLRAERCSQRGHRSKLTKPRWMGQFEYRPGPMSACHGVTPCSTRHAGPAGGAADSTSETGRGRAWPRHPHGQNLLNRQTWLTRRPCPNRPNGPCEPACGWVEGIDQLTGRRHLSGVVRFPHVDGWIYGTIPRAIFARCRLRPPPPAGCAPPERSSFPAARP